MAHKKGASSSRNGRDSTAQRLGVKRFGGQSFTQRKYFRAPDGVSRRGDRIWRRVVSPVTEIRKEKT